MKNSRLTLNNKNIETFFLSLFVWICILFPADFFGLKELSFAILLFLNINLILEELEKGSIYALIGILFPILLFIWSFVLRGEIFGIFPGVSCCAMILLVAPIKKYRINYSRIFLSAVCLVAFLTFFIFLADLIGIFDVNADTSFTRFINKNGIGFIGKSSSYPFYYKIFIKTVPLVVFLIAGSIKKRNWILVVFSYLVLFISGTRANVFFSFLCFGICFCFGKNVSSKIKLALRIAMVLSCAVVAALNFDKLYSAFHNVFFALSHSSDAIRSGHLLGLYQLYKNNPIYLFTGTGIGSSFYSFSRGYTSSIEWAYLDLLRQIGIIFFALFLLFVLYPFTNKKIKSIDKVAYAAYLLIAATNPLLFSSTAFLAYIYIYSIPQSRGSEGDRLYGR